MTDHLEPYRRMARSIRFFPPLSLTQPSQESVQEPVPPVGRVDSSWKIKSETDAKPTQEPPIDPSEHAAALVHEAVRKPTVLPPTYAIQENIGDRISRLASRKPVAKPVATVINPFKIPPPIPGYNETSEHAIAPEAIEDDTNQQVNNAKLETSATDVAEAPPLMEAPEPQTPEADTEEQVEEVEASVPTTSVAEALTGEQTPAPQATDADIEEWLEEAQALALATDVDETPTVEETPAPQATEADTKKQIDDTQLDASASATVTTEAPTVAETPNEVGEGVVESSEVEETAKGETTTTEAAEPVAVEETANDEEETEAITVEETTAEEATVGVVTEPIAVQEVADNEVAAVVAERVVVEETPDDFSDTNTPAEVVSKSDAVTDTTPTQLADSEAPGVEDAETPSLLERVVSAVETVVTAFTHPEADKKDSEAEKEPVSSEPAATEAPATATATVEPVTTGSSTDKPEDTQALNRSEQVSASVEAVAAPLKDSQVAQKSLDAAVEPTPATKEKATDTKTDEITCPACESTNLRKNGRRKGKQRYACKDCGKQFAAEAEDEPKNKASSSVEASNANGSELEPEFSTSSKRQKSKKKTKAKGFGNSKTDK